MRSTRSKILSLLILATTACDASTPLVSPAFSTHMILQRDRPNPIWGWTDPGRKVRLTFDGKPFEGVSEQNGKWQIVLPSTPAGGPHRITIEEPEKVVFEDILFGDVWLCSGQSNMGFNVASSNDGRNVSQAATDSQIRLLTIPTIASPVPLETFEGGSWQVCSPETVEKFSAVGYFFGKNLGQELNVPIGLIHASWGGTLAEAWMSGDALRPLGDFNLAMINLQQRYQADLAVGRDPVEPWFHDNDAGSTGAEPAWAARDLDDAGWPTMTLPQEWEKSGIADLADLDGVVWFRKKFVVPAVDAEKASQLRLGAIDDEDAVWVNGHKIGGSQGYSKMRNYALPSGVLKEGMNVIAVRVLDRGYGGGMVGPAEEMKILNAGGNPVSLSGSWTYKVGADLKKCPRLPERMSEDPYQPAVLYNGMISPLLPFGIKGAIWYQGEGNAGRAHQYRTLLPTLIRDWRARFGQGNFPFYIVQLANFSSRLPDPGDSDWAELREAQAMTAKSVPNTGLAVAIDVGEAKDIHPKNKQDVGRRLALAALAGTYGKQIEPSGPVFQSAKLEGRVIRLNFDHTSGGLTAKGAVKGFAIAGNDRHFVWADATIEGSEVLLSSPLIDSPVAARYAWANNPEATLYNTSGLPAVPFRTDEWPGVTDGKK